MTDGRVISFFIRPLLSGFTAVAGLTVTVQANPETESRIRMELTGHLLRLLYPLIFPLLNCRFAQSCNLFDHRKDSGN